MDKEQVPSYVLDGTYQLKNLIKDVETSMIDQNIKQTLVKITGSFDLDEIVYAGFVPYAVIVDDRFSHDLLIAHFIEKLTTEEQDLWFHRTLDDVMGSLNIDYEHYGKFMYASLAGWKEFTMKTSISFPLILYFPDQLYSSMRPKTDMSQYRQVTSATYDPNSVVSYGIASFPSLINKILINGIRLTKLAIPVTRYSEGMSKGLFFDTYDENTHCGTFYYHEPESTTNLTFNTARIYRNKYEAMLKLYAEFNIEKDIEPPWMWKAADNSYITPGDHSHIFKAYFLDRKSLPVDMKMNIEDYDHPYEEDKNEPDYPQILASLPQRRRYIGVSVDLYAKEDKYDQDLCRTAAENGIDVVILTDMIGRHQIVVEVLDTRVRQISMSNLIYPYTGN